LPSSSQTCLSVCSRASSRFSLYCCRATIFLPVGKVLLLLLTVLPTAMCVWKAAVTSGGMVAIVETMGSVGLMSMHSPAAVGHCEFRWHCVRLVLLQAVHSAVPSVGAHWLGGQGLQAKGVVAPLSGLYVPGGHCLRNTPWR